MKEGPIDLVNNRPVEHNSQNKIKKILTGKSNE